MAIAFSCPKCDADIKVRDEMAGRRMRCANCGNATTVPEIDDAGESPAPSRRAERGESRSLRTAGSGVAAFYKIFVTSGIAVFAMFVFVIVMLLFGPRPG